MQQEEPFGASTGGIDKGQYSDLSNDFATISNNNIDGPLTSDRVQPRQVASGVTRGTWRMNNADGSYITIGVIPGTNDEFGIAFFDRDNNLISKNQGTTQYLYDTEGNLIYKNTGETDYKYDVTTGKNWYQSGKLPDGTYGLVMAEPGYDVSELFI